MEVIDTMAKGDGVKNETAVQRADRMRGVTVSAEEVAKASLPAPDISRMMSLIAQGPRAYKDKDELAANVIDYFSSCMVPVVDDEGEQVGMRWARKPTLGSLAVHLGIHRETLLNYSKSGPFVDVIKSARGIITAFTEDLLIEGKNPVGCINTLVNMHCGWVADEKTIKVEPVMPDRAAQSPEEIAAFLDDKALPEPEFDRERI